MRLLCVLCVLILIAFATGAAQTSIENSQSEDEKYIRSSESEWAESVATNDSSVVERIFADDCVWVLDGRILTKAQAVADAKNGPGDFLSDHLEYAHVRFFGGTAVVQGSEIWTRKGGRKGRFIWTDTWLRRNRQWQIVASEDVSVPTRN
jgi:ketosteroid isomerase-like protein